MLFLVMSGGSLLCKIPLGSRNINIDSTSVAPHDKVGNGPTESKSPSPNRRRSPSPFDGVVNIRWVCGFATEPQT